MATFDLFSAVKDGDTDAVKDQLTKRNCRAKLNERNEWGDTVLHLAAEAGNSDVCQMLIAGGASVTVRNNRGETCLHRAAVGGHTECVRAIVGKFQIHYTVSPITIIEMTDLFDPQRNAEIITVVTFRGKVSSFIFGSTEIFAT